ncbi:hypothetical protein BLOT_013248 [Blomia tropicalis]|nr:hypothetical protein BLOT_013248 [Blomia tropicalis]
MLYSMGDDKDGDHHDDRPIEFAGNHCISIAPHRIESKPNSVCHLCFSAKCTIKYGTEFELIVTTTTTVTKDTIL